VLLICKKALYFLILILYNITKYHFWGNIMKKLALLFVSCASFSILSANPAVLGGITFNFGGNGGDALQGAGATVKVLSSGEDKKPVVGAGFSYYPWADKSKQFGLDVSAGYNMKNTAIMGGWDFIQKQPTVSLGYNKSISGSDKYGDGIQDAVCKNGKK